MTTTNDRSIEMLKAALDMEEKGKIFYEKAIKECKSQVGIEIFETLRKDEIVHTERIKAIYTELKGSGKWDDKWASVGHAKDGLQGFFKDLAKRNGKSVRADANDIKALDIGIDFERRAVTFYEDQLKKSSDPVEKRFIDKMIGEEKGHHKVLEDTKLYLVDPSAWFVEQERQGFDG